MPHRPGDWYQVARALSREECIGLIKALTVAERDLVAEHDLPFGPGSVSPVIWLYRYLLESTGDDFTELRDWIRRHTDNRYLPGAPASMADYHRQLAQDEAARRQREQAEEAAAIARRMAHEKEQVKRAASRLRYRELRTALLAELEPLSAVERLDRIARDTEHPVTYYPPEYATLDPESLRAITAALRRALMNRLSDRRKGIWRALREQLERNA